MQARGQVFSLDLMIGIVLVVLAAGILLVVLQQNVEAQTAGQESRHLFEVASTASQLLVTNPELTCDLMGGTTKLSEIPNCLIGSANPTNTQLGIPSEYDFCITGLASYSKPCSSSVPSSLIPAVHSIDRQIVTPNNGTTVSKKDYLSCLKTNSCSLTKKTITLQVWRIP